MSTQLESRVAFRLDKKDKWAMQYTIDYICNRLEEDVEAVPQSTDVSFVSLSNAATIKDQRRILDEAFRIIADIRWNTDRAFNLELREDQVLRVGTELRLLLKPADETADDYMRLYMHYFDNVRPAVSPAFPYVVLAQLRQEVDEERLAEVLSEVNKAIKANPSPLSLSVWRGFTAQRQSPKGWVDWPLTICFVCDGGLCRSGIAAAIVNRRAMEKGYPIHCEPRAAFTHTAGKEIPFEVKEVLRRHGTPFSRDVLQQEASFLYPGDYPAFSAFIPLTHEAAFMIADLGKPVYSDRFIGVKDPYKRSMEIYEEVYHDIEQRVEALMDNLEKNYCLTDLQGM